MRLALVAVAFLLAGCSEAADSDTEETEADCPCNVHVYVSNQSFDDPTADMLVQVDGTTVFAGDADVESQHNWMLREANVAAGSHTITARERDTGTTASESFTVPAGEERWIVVDYWNSDGNREITINVNDEPVAFD